MEQAIIQVQFVPNVETGEVEPFLPQYGGVQGDRNAATVSFAVPESLQGDNFRYRIEGEDGAGGFVTTACLPLDDDGCVVTLLDERFTAAGGQILVRLVVSEVQNDNEIATVRSFDGRLFFADAPAADAASPFRDTLSALLCRNEEKLEQMNDTAAALSEQVGAFNARVGASEGMLADHGTRLTAAEQTTAALSGQMSECGARVTANEGALASHGTRLTAAEAALAAVESRLTADEQTADTLDTWVSEISNNFAQFKTTAETKEDEPTPWKFIQKIVRAGLAKSMFSVGDVLCSTHSDYGVIEWEVIGFDHDTLVDDRFSHSMTLQAKNALHRTDGTFDLKMYDTPDSTHTHGVSDWETSDLRTWLNSTEAAGHWGAYGENDATPAYYGQDGFLRGFSESFLAVVGTVEVPVALGPSNTTHLGSTFDKIFLPSRSEVFSGAATGNVLEGAPYAAYDAPNSALSTAGLNADQNRVKKLNGTATAWWTRSVHPMMTEKAMRVGTDGVMSYVTPDTACAVAPAFCIY